MYGNPYMQQFNPYQQLQMQQQQPQQEITKVNGENGARAYPMGANSSVLLLDSSGLLVWLVTTDGAGYKTVSPYDITPHKTAPTPDYSTLEQRIERLEGLINGNTTDTSAARHESYAVKPEFSTDKRANEYSKSGSESTNSLASSY